MEKLGIAEIVIVLVAMVTPILGVFIGLFLARRSKRKREAEWHARNPKFKPEENHLL